jgi:hypothetical protein
VGPTPDGVVVEDVPVGAGVDTIGCAWVTVNVAVPESPVEPLTVTTYWPRDTVGTEIIVLATRNSGPVTIVPTFDAPKVTLNV